MARQNQISAALSDTDKQTIFANLEAVKLLLPFLINLNEKDRKRLRKMGKNSLEYVMDCLTGAKAFPKLLAGDFDVAEFEKDATLTFTLSQLQVVVDALSEALNDSIMAAGSDAMVAADEVYDAMKKASGRDANVKTLVDKMAKRFAAQGNRKPKKP